MNNPQPAQTWVKRNQCNNCLSVSFVEQRQNLRNMYFTERLLEMLRTIRVLIWAKEESLVIKWRIAGGAHKADSATQSAAGPGVTSRTVYRAKCMANFSYQCAW